MSEIVRLKNVSKFYRLGEVSVRALNNVALELRAGEFAAVVGASGSGKSTLLNMIGCIDIPDDGEIWIGDQNAVQLSDDAKSDLRNQRIGFIFQSFNLVPVLSVLENVELPMIINPKISPGERKSRAEQALIDVGLQDYRRNKPDQLSGGQRQRVAIARALVNSPMLVLADEPTANLDSVTSNKIIDLMLKLNEDKHVTFFFSTHDEKLMTRVKRIYHIRDGVVGP